MGLAPFRAWVDGKRSINLVRIPLIMNIYRIAKHVGLMKSAEVALDLSVLQDPA